MPLFEIKESLLSPVPEASFTEMKIRERGDLQRLLRSNIQVLADDLFVITEEFGEWEDSRRRIDLLAIDKSANLVVIELKRTQDGGHMELQAVRYASMVSTMTFSRAVEVHADFLKQTDQNGEDAQKRLLEFLGLTEPDEENFASEVRIILVSEDFGKELTSAVLWLRDYDVDICCVRLKPYQNGNSRFIDVQQIIPLPEADDYQVQLRQKQQEGKKERQERNNEYLRFWQALVVITRQKKTRHSNIKPSRYNWLGASSGFRGFGFTYATARNESTVSLYIDRGSEAENRKVFDALCLHRESIEKAFGDKLIWESLDGRRSCHIYASIAGGYRSPETEWPRIHSAMVDAMIRLEIALLPELKSLNL